MLTELRIENFAIIQKLELHLQSGLTTFTGETGAGKSIILDAITALVGGRADPTFIRAGAERASLEAVFRLPEAGREALLELLQREELLEDDAPNELTLSREIRREGRSSARINGHLVGQSVLREVGSCLVDIHGQSEHLSLLNIRQHIHLLDRYAGSEEPLAAYRLVFHQLQGVRRELAALRQSEQDALRRTDLLNYQVREIEAAQVVPAEEETLRQERSRLSNAEALAGLAQQAIAALDESTPDASAVTDLLGQVVQALQSLSRIDSSQSELSAQAATLADLASELVRDLRGYVDEIEFNPRRLEQIEERLDTLHTLKRKYGGSLEAVLAFAEDARRQLDTIAHAGERIAALEEEEAALLERAAKSGLALSQKRQAAAAALSLGVERELDDLSMAGARFAVDQHTQPDPNGLKLPDGQPVSFDSTGIDTVEFLIAPNPGEGLKPLVKIASGGETSRLMLALKNVLVQADAVPTLIFDEIDQGIGGRVGAVVGEKLWQLGRRHQVLCVTHLPQLAAFGDQHFSVRKLVQSGRTITQVDQLSAEKRLEELALMLGSLTDANRLAAQETLQTARDRCDELRKRGK
jgi:DNA repair protein RecN (Recombination protein N)